MSVGLKSCIIFIFTLFYNVEWEIKVFVSDSGDTEPYLKKKRNFLTFSSFGRFKSVFFCFFRDTRKKNRT